LKDPSQIQKMWEQFGGGAVVGARHAAGLSKLGGVRRCEN
jgi:hypothetical protein